MITVLCVVGWLAVGCIVAMLGLWLDIFKFDAFGNELDWMPVSATVIGWPIAVVAGVIAAAMRATLNAKARRTTIREEMEREARKAAKEVEDFLRSAR